MEILILAFYSIMLLYAAAIGSLIYGFVRLPAFELYDTTPTTRFSILIPIRNEAENLPQLLSSLLALNYPATLFEVLFIDDDSSDTSLVLLQNTKMPFALQVLPNQRKSGSPKKDAITTGIPMAQNEWIITTDADCTFPREWLLSFDNYIRKHHPEMVAGPVTYDCGRSFSDHFQQLDFMSLQGATMGSFGLHQAFLCNGANFAYTKKLFYTLNGFEGNDKIASGDDVFLLQKAVASLPKTVHYLKCKAAVVHTMPLQDWKAIFHQRIRWASKTASYNSSFGKLLAVVVLAGNLAFLGIFVAAAAGFSIVHLAILLVLKIGVDWVLVLKTQHFITGSRPRFLIASSLFYPVFNALVGCYSLFGSYQWKGRSFK